MAKKKKGHHAHHHGHARGHGSHPHIGPITHDDMVTLHGSRGAGHSDNHASAEHHAQNKAHGMDHGLSPKGGYHDNGHAQKGGAPSEAENCEYS